MQRNVILMNSINKQKTHFDAPDESVTQGNCKQPVHTHTRGNLMQKLYGRNSTECVKRRKTILRKILRIALLNDERKFISECLFLRVFFYFYHFIFLFSISEYISFRYAKTKTTTKISPSFCSQHTHMHLPELSSSIA